MHRVPVDQSPTRGLGLGYSQREAVDYLSRLERPSDALVDAFLDHHLPRVDDLDASLPRWQTSRDPRDVIMAQDQRISSVLVRMWTEQQEERLDPVRFVEPDPIVDPDAEQERAARHRERLIAELEEEQEQEAHAEQTRREALLADVDAVRSREDFAEEERAQHIIIIRQQGRALAALQARVQDLTQQLATQRAKGACIVCHEAPAAVLLLPCAHLKTCFACQNQNRDAAPTVRRDCCMFCRQPFTRVVHVFR